MSNGIARRCRRARTWLWAAVLLALCLPVFAAGPPVDHLSVPGPLRLDGTDFKLAWSVARPPAYFRHEYLPEGQTLPRYRQMVLLDYLAASVTPAELARHKIGELEQRKATDPVVNFDVIVNEAGSSVLLDFLMSGVADDGALIIEWNAYRYQAVTGGVVLLGISRRGYGAEDGRRFIGEELKSSRQGWLEELASLDMPVVTPATP